MEIQDTTPYKCHVFVCTNDRKGQRASCADGDSTVIRETLKQKIKDKGLRESVRISKCGCMGLCSNGPNVIIYPQKIWFSQASPQDIERILEEIESVINSA